MPDILSVGIDIGTSTTQVIFSRISLDNTAGYFTAPRVAIVGKEIVYKSDVHFTPLVGASLLDGDAVRGLVAAEFARAGFRPSDVDTGAVIITGESARKENAALVLQKLSDFAGEFVVSTAGPDLESVVAGKGSGAWQYSIDNDCAVANLDIGGGTTNIVLFSSGDAVGKSCYDIGGRLIRLAPDGTVQTISPSAARIAADVGVALTVGQRTTAETLSRITDRMAQLLAQAVGLAPAEPLLDAVRTSRSGTLPLTRPIGRLCFSGGVADCMRMEGDPFRFGDIGVLLGRSLRAEPIFKAARIIDAGETIRATVVGAGTYTTSLSGSTITYSDGLFPLKNLPALKLSYAAQQEFLDRGASALEARVRWFLEQSDEERLLLALPGKLDPSYPELKRMASCIVQAMDAALPAGAPVLVALEQDIAKALGALMRTALGGARPLACIDGVKIEDGDYVDLGRPLMDGLVVPVVVKTLLFG